MSAYDFLSACLLAILSLVYGWGLLMINPPHEDFRAARVCFWVSALAWWGTVLMWGTFTNQSFVVRAIIVGAMAAFGAVVLMQGLRTVAARETAARQIAAPSQPAPAPATVTNPVDESLPGAAFAVVFSMSDMAVKKRQYLFEYGTQEGARVAFYISKSDRFTFLATDRNGESYPIEVPLGKDGIPILRPVQLYCDVGSGSNYAFMRVFVNGRQVERRDFQFPIDMGSRQWVDGTLGANLGQSNNASFTIVEFLLWTVTLNAHDLNTITQNEMTAFNITNKPTNLPSSPLVIPARSTPTGKPNPQPPPSPTSP